MLFFFLLFKGEAKSKGPILRVPTADPSTSVGDVGPVLAGAACGSCGQSLRCGEVIAGGPKAWAEPSGSFNVDPILYSQPRFIDRGVGAPLKVV